ncbi:MAG: tyrosine-type recombinase/integrase [Bacteroidota bacterium]
MKGLVEKGEGVFYGTFYDRRRSPTRKYPKLKARTESAAEREWAALQDEYAAGRFDPWRDRRADDLTLEAALALYTRAHRHQAQHTRENKASTVRTFLATAKTPYLADISEADVEAFIRARERDGRAASTIDVQLGQLRHVLAWAVDEGYLRENPVDRVRRRRQSRRTGRARVKDARPPREALLPSSLGRISSAIAAESSPFADRAHLPAVYEFAACTGLRLRELSSRNRSHVRISRIGEHAVCGQLSVSAWHNPRTGERFETKTGRDRVVPLPPRAALVASQLLDASPTDNPDAPLFLGPKGDRLDPSHTSRLFSKYRKAVGLPGTISFHGLRHSWISWLVMLDVSPYAVLEIAGHGSFDTQRRYAKVKQEFMAGRAREVATEILSFVCPGVDADTIKQETAGLAGVDVSGALALGAGHAPLTGFSSLRIQDVLFGGALYRETVPSALLPQTLSTSVPLIGTSLSTDAHG